MLAAVPPDTNALWDLFDVSRNKQVFPPSVFLSKLITYFLSYSSNLHYPGEASRQVIDCSAYTFQNCILHLPQGYFAIAPTQGPTDSLGVFYICLLFCWAAMAAYWHYAVH